MSYNRRGTPNQNLGNIGSRRPVVTNNFVSGGQLTPQKGGIQQGQQQQGYNTQQQVNRPQQQPQQKLVAQQQQQSPQQQKPQLPIQQPEAHQQQSPQQQIPQQQTSQQPIPQTEEAMENGAEVEVKVEGEKRKWPHRKIPKKEKMKRRNQRLSKLLQPKSALMILNELVKNPTYSVVDYVSVEGTQYKATVLVDGMGHTGFGKSKAGAKNTAAEMAIKYLIKNKKITQFGTSSEGDAEKMDTSETNEETDAPIPWQQVASFAIFKLFNSWGEDLSVTAKEEQLHAPKELRPAKKLPDNAASLNPLMVVNQMLPHTQYEEVSQIGMPPNCTYTMKCTVDNQSFTGSGTTKKMAKKNAAYAICVNLLGIEYPPEANIPSQ